MAIELTVPTSSVWPSAGALATKPVPMLPPAPDLFSTTNGTPNFACRCCCRMRASKSADPPAANGTTMVTGRCGQASCACAGAASATTAATARTRRMFKPPRLLRWRTIIQRMTDVYRRWRSSHRLEMGIAALVEVLVGVAHGLGLAAPEHDLEVDRLEAVVLISVDDADGTRNAFPGPEAGGEALAALVLDEDVEVALEHEETLFDLVGVGGITLSRLHIHDRQGEVLRRDDGRIAVLARTARADEAVLRALVALDLGVFERRPIRFLLAKAPDIFLHDVLDRNIDQFRRTRMSCNAHGSLLSNGIVGIESIPALRRQSIKPPVRMASPTGTSLACCLRELPDASGRERKFARLRAESAQRVRHGIGHHAAGSDDAALAGAFCAQRIDRRGVIFQDNSADVGEVAGGGDEIIGERAGQQLALLIVDEMLHHGAAEPLHHRADRLPVHRQGIDDAPAIRDHHVVDELDVAELGIDRHVGGMGAVCVSVLLVEEGALGRNAFARKPVQGDGFTAGPDRLAAFDDFDFGRLAAQTLRRLRADRFAQIRRRIEHRRSAHHHRTRVVGAVTVADVRGTAVKDAADAIDGHFERVGGDLRERRLQPLADRG